MEHVGVRIGLGADRAVMTGGVPQPALYQQIRELDGDASVQQEAGELRQRDAPVSAGGLHPGPRQRPKSKGSDTAEVVVHRHLSERDCFLIDL
ncbi:hypothetical protein [Micrococcus sp. IITD107]|uniref:hypothetical protein n=1 Tax=Micrococcus sp. IITD107 TaxID=3342790 RepID=UPI0035B9340B